MRFFPITTVAIAALFCSGAFSSLLAAGNTSQKSPKLTGTAACYSRRLKGHKTTSGERYDPSVLTASHSTIPVGSQVKVTNVENGKSVVVRVNDHMSSRGRRKTIMDLSEEACKELDFGKGGKAQVKLEVENPSTATSH